MNQKQFQKLYRLVDLRKRMAHLQLQEAQNFLQACEDEIASAKEKYRKITEEGKAQISDFLAGKYEVHTNYPSRLSSLRALTARVEFDVQNAKSALDEAVYAKRNAVLQLEHKQKEYHSAVLRMEKLDALSKRFSEENSRIQGNVQEMDRLDHGLKNNTDNMAL